MADVSSTKSYAKLAALVALLLAGVAAVKFTSLGQQLTLSNVLEALQGLRASPWAPVVFVVGYAVATALALPGSALTLAGGVVFGFWTGTLLNSIAANIGANAAFVVSRFLGREGLERIAGSRLSGLNRATEQHGFFGLLVLRLIPLVPFNALNFGSGLTAMKWRDYALATVIGIFPGTVVYTFFADALVQGSSRERWIAVGLLLALSVVPFIAKKLGFVPSSTPTTEPA